MRIYTDATRKLIDWLARNVPEVTRWDDLRAAHVNGFTGDLLAAGRSAAYASNLYRALQRRVVGLVISPAVFALMRRRFFYLDHHVRLAGPFRTPHRRTP